MASAQGNSPFTILYDPVSAFNRRLQSRQIGKRDAHKNSSYNIGKAGG